MANLTNGKILCANGSGYSADFQNGPYFWHIFDPESGSITERQINKYFCMGQAVLPSGKVLCAGGALRYDTVDPDGLWKGFPLLLNMILVQTQ